jgi:anti-sigma regulatory factor (Ser/Thr protein kinase)
MRDVVTLHFSTPELGIIDQVCRAAGMALREIGDGEGRDLAAAGEPLYVLLAVHDKAELRTARRAVTNAPLHRYALGVLFENRQLVCAVQAVPDADAFFLPPVAAEVEATLARLRGRDIEGTAHAAMISGTEFLTHDLTWRTDAVHAGAAARYLAGLLQQVGFYRTPVEVDQVALSLEEAIVNSLEHGNLELHSELRSAEAGYERLRNERLGIERYAGRTLRLALRIDREQATVTITDAGPGFDISKVESRTATPDAPTRDTILANSGKGFALIARSFDDIALTDAGRQITLVRRRPASDSPDKV